jgi:MoxR-like ATPase
MASAAHHLLTMDSSGNGSATQVEWFAGRYEVLARNVESFIRGKPEVVRAALVCMLAEGHLLIEDVPGVGKTSLAKAVASSIGATMRRIQFTPDLLPTDVTGVQVYDDRSRQFEFRPGPVFANIVLADEINRASPKTQSALLEVMDERQVTMDGTTYPVAHPFVVMATSNPVEHEGVYRLPEAQLDRFLMRIEVGYPNAVAEREVIENRARGYSPEQLNAVLTVEELRAMVGIAHQIYIAPVLQEYIVAVTSATRRLPELRLGVSPRGSLGVATAAQALAAAAGRPFVTPQDVKQVAPNVLAHRMILRPEAQLQGHAAETLLDSILSSVPVPQERQLA